MTMDRALSSSLTFRLCLLVQQRQVVAACLPHRRRLLLLLLLLQWLLPLHHWALLQPTFLRSHDVAGAAMTSDLTGAVSQARCTCFVDQAAGLWERLSTLDTAMKSTMLQELAELFSMRSNARVCRRRDQHTVRDVGRMVHPARNLIAVVGNAADFASNGVLRHQDLRGPPPTKIALREVNFICQRRL